MERIPLKVAPKLIEAVIQEMQVALGAGLPWLNHVFGKAERTHRDYDGQKRFYTPSVYVGEGKYESIVPDKNDWGNYCFFYLDDPQTLNDMVRVMPYFKIEGDLNLIVWGDLRDIESVDDRNIESVKSEILQVLGGMRLTNGRVTWERVWEQDQGVFDDFSNSDDDGQFMLWPYFAFRFKGTVECDSGCVTQ